jgi:type VI protein secretion system component Hcp
MATKKAKTTKRLAPGKKLQATKPLTTAKLSLYSSCCTGTHIKEAALE